MSAPDVIFGCVAVRYALQARGWSPAISNSSLRASLLARPPTTTMRSRKAASGSRTGVIGKPLPAAAGVHLSMMMPFGTAKNDKRAARGAAICAAEANAGTIASSSGSASAVPAPRRNVRLGIAFRKTIMSAGSPHLKRHAGDDPHDDRRPAVVTGRRVAHDRPHRRHVVRLDTPSQRVGQQPFRGRRHELVLLVEEDLPQSDRAVDLRAVGKHARCIDARPPPAETIEILERKPERVHPRMTAGAHGARAMQLHALPHRQLADVLVLLQRGD